MSAQVIISPSGERQVVLPEVDFLKIVDALEDIEDAAAAQEALARLASGEDELIPLAVVDRLFQGESKVRVWREHRRMSVSELADAAKLSQPYVSQIESGARQRGKGAMAVLAKALRIAPDDLAANTPET